MGHSKIHFDHQQLIPCRRSIEFVTWAKGAALERAAWLDALVAKGKVTQELAAEGKRLLSESVCLLIGFCKSVSPNRLGEETLPYRTEQRLTSKIKRRIKITI